PARAAAPPRRPAPARLFWGHRDTVDQVVFSPEGTHLITVCVEGVTKLWDIRAGKELRRLYRVPLPSDGAIERPTYELAIAPGAHLLAVARTDTDKVGEPGEIALWSLGTGKRLRTWNRQVGRGALALSFSPDGKQLASTHFVGRVGVEGPSL